MALATIIVAPLLTAAAAKCCVRSPFPASPICERYWDGDAVALIDVTNIIEHRYSRRVTLRTINVFRGQAPSEVTISDPRTDCGVAFPAKKRYLAWLWQTKSGRWQGYADIGETSAEDLQYAQSMKNPRATGRIYGTLDKPRPASIVVTPFRKPELPSRRGTEVVAVGNDRNYVSPVGDDLRFDLPDIASGRYQVEVKGLPSSLSVDTRDVEVHGGGCNELFLFSASASSVSGRVTGSGQPPHLAQVFLVPVDSRNNLLRNASRWVLTDGLTGVFRFTHVEPGSYNLVFELDHTPTIDVPYASTFYHAGTHEKEATVVNVRAGEKIENLRFDVGNEVPRRHVHVHVSWADGSPAENATAYLRDAHNPYSSVAEKQTPTDVSGEALLEGFVDTDYDVAANAVCRGRAISNKIEEKTISASSADAFVGLTIKGRKCPLVDWQLSREDE